MSPDYKQLNIDGTLYETEVPEGRFTRWEGPPDGSELRAFIPGIIHEIAVRPGGRITQGQVVLLLEAMKMYNEVTAETDGRVEEVLVQDGEIVEKDQLLLRIVPARRRD
jgi:biotin carboxyl carrier protein